MGDPQGWSSTEEVVRACLVGRGDRASLGSCEQLGTATGWGECWVLGTGRRGAGWWEQTEGTESRLPDLGMERVSSG